ncbi:hypothetical protein Tco_0033641 [Tanacetum coccineum]
MIDDRCYGCTGRRDINRNGDDSHSSGVGIRRLCTVAVNAPRDFLKCNLDLQGQLRELVGPYPMIQQANRGKTPEGPMRMGMLNRGHTKDPRLGVLSELATSGPCASKCHQVQPDFVTYLVTARLLEMPNPGANQGAMVVLNVVLRVHIQEGIVEIEGQQKSGTEDSQNGKRLEDGPVLREFPEVFPEDLPVPHLGSSSPIRQEGKVVLSDVYRLQDLNNIDGLRTVTTPRIDDLFGPAAKGRVFIQDRSEGRRLSPVDEFEKKTSSRLHSGLDTGVYVILSHAFCLTFNATPCHGYLMNPGCCKTAILESLYLFLIDDILIYSKSKMEHEGHLRQILNWLRREELYSSLTLQRFESIKGIGRLLIPNRDSQFFGLAAIIEEFYEGFSR